MSISPVHLSAIGAITAFGDPPTTHAALLRGERALRPVPVLGVAGGELVPLALAGGRGLDESAPPEWFALLRSLAAAIPGEGWGSPRRPVFVTSSNFGVGGLYAYRVRGEQAHLAQGAPHTCVERVAALLGWGPNVSIVSHACVSAHLGLLLASRALEAGLAEQALVFSFDFISPFVTGGFHALKILNAGMPAPYADRPTGSIGLGDGAAFAVLTRESGDFTITAQSLHNEMHHFTANRSDGVGFVECLTPLRAAAEGRRIWLKGHGTGTLEAGRLECATFAAAFPERPMVGWKGSLGHTLGSCGLVELALVVESLRTGRAPGTVGTIAPTFSPQVAIESFDVSDCDSALCASNAFGGAHAAFLINRA